MNNKPLLEDLRLFCTIARKSSFIETAKEVGASPAYISKRIAVLEETLGVRLFHRTTRSVVMTEDGSNAHDWARRILDDVDQMLETVTSAKRIPRGLLKISTSFALGRKYVSPIISEFAAMHPDLKIQLELFDRNVDMINEGFDLDIRVGPVHEPHLFAKRIIGSQRVLCASPAYLQRHGMPASLSELTRHQCLVIRERNQSFGIWRMLGPNGMGNRQRSPAAWHRIMARSFTNGRWTAMASSCARSGMSPSASSRAVCGGYCLIIIRKPIYVRCIRCS